MSHLLVKWPLNFLSISHKSLIYYLLWWCDSRAKISQILNAVLAVTNTLPTSLSKTLNSWGIQPVFSRFLTKKYTKFTVKNLFLVGAKITASWLFNFFRFSEPAYSVFVKRLHQFTGNYHILSQLIFNFVGSLFSCILVNLYNLLDFNNLPHL